MPFQLIVRSGANAGQIIPLIAGIFRMPTMLFHSANMAASFVWAFIVLAPGAGLSPYLF